MPAHAVAKALWLYLKLNAKSMHHPSSSLERPRLRIAEAHQMFRLSMRALAMHCF